MAKKYFWLKLSEDFFNTDEIQLLTAKKNGEKYLIFLLRLMLKSIKHEDCILPLIGDNKEEVIGNLSVITNTNIDTVRGAFEAFQQLKLIEPYQEEGQAIIIPISVDMVGSVSDSAMRMRRLRAKQKAKQLPETASQSDVESESESEIEKEEEGERKTTCPPFIKPKLWQSMSMDLQQAITWLINHGKEKTVAKQWKRFTYEKGEKLDDRAAGNRKIIGEDFEPGIMTMVKTEKEIAGQRCEIHNSLIVDGECQKCRRIEIDKGPHEFPSIVEKLRQQDKEKAG